LVVTRGGVAGDWEWVRRRETEVEQLRCATLLSWRPTSASICDQSDPTVALEHMVRTCQQRLHLMDKYPYVAGCSDAV
jgi:hypothetical protein